MDREMGIREHHLELVACGDPPDHIGDLGSDRADDGRLLAGGQPHPKAHEFLAAGLFLEQLHGDVLEALGQLAQPPLDGHYPGLEGHCHPGWDLDLLLAADHPHLFVGELLILIKALLGHYQLGVRCGMDEKWR